MTKKDPMYLDGKTKIFNFMNECFCYTCTEVGLQGDFEYFDSFSKLNIFDCSRNGFNSIQIKYKQIWTTCGGCELLQRKKTSFSLFFHILFEFHCAKKNFNNLFIFLFLIFSFIFNTKKAQFFSFYHIYFTSFVKF